MSQTATIRGIKIGSGDYTDYNDTIDTSGRVQQRIDEAIDNIDDNFVVLEPTAEQVILNKQNLTSTGNLIVGATGQGNEANLTVHGTGATDGTFTSGNTLTVTSGGLTVSAGGASITGATSSSGNLTVGATGSGNEANLTVHGTGATDGTFTSGGKLTVSADGAEITGNSSVDGTFSTTGNTTIGGTTTSTGALIVGTSQTPAATTLNGTLNATGNTTIGGTTTSSGDLTVGATGAGNGANAQVYGDITASGTITGANITVPSSGGGLVFTIVPDS